MPFEGQDNNINGLVESPGGFAFGIQGAPFGEPKPTSITFFLDNTAIVADQYGRRIKGVILPNGTGVRFAEAPPESDRDGTVASRPQFATHKQTIEALRAEDIDWLGYTVRYRDRDGTNKVKTKLTKDAAEGLRTKLAQTGITDVRVMRTITCAGWPQLTYEQLMGLPELPPTPLEELQKIRDPKLRRDAMKARREVDDLRAKELQMEVE